MIKILLISSLVFLGALKAQTEEGGTLQTEPVTWFDENTGTTLVLYQLPKAGSVQDCRNQAAGFLEGPIHSGHFLPKAMGNLTFADLPGLYMKGSLYDGEQEQEALYLLLFSEEFSAMVVAVASRSPDAKSVREHLGPRRKALKLSKAVVEEIGPKIRDGVGELQEIAKKLVEQKRTTRSSQL